MTMIHLCHCYVTVTLLMLADCGLLSAWTIYSPMASLPIDLLPPRFQLETILPLPVLTPPIARRLRVLVGSQPLAYGLYQTDGCGDVGSHVLRIGST